jgi:hypothetical protein
MNNTGIDLLMTALAEERWLHIARRLIVVRIEPKIFPTSMISATLGRWNMAGLSIAGQMKVSTLQEGFQKEFGRWRHAEICSTLCPRKYG